jgi:dihydrofolate synthase / folylpolyglutamate synthase
LSAAQRIAQSLARIDALHRAEIDLGLDRVRALLAKLGDPHHQLPPTVHVAGTNGKGSCIAMLEAMAQAQGLRVHIHTSPHLIHLNERYVIAGKALDDGALADLLEATENANGGAPATQFELLVAAMFLAFAQTSADLALIEVGLGGEFDATNVLEKPACCIITSIAHDHADFLGDDLADIARAKAGIIKPEIPVFSAIQPPIVRDVIERRCARLRAPLFFMGEDFHVRREDGRLIYEDETRLLDLPLPRLLGQHQVQNAGLSLAAALHLDLAHDAMAHGLEAVRWPARMQVLSHGALAKQAQASRAQIIIDGAHNPHAARALADSLAGMNKTDQRSLVLVAGVQDTKDAVRFFAAFKALDPDVICVPVPGAPHSMKLSNMQTAARKAGLSAGTAPDVEVALHSALGTKKEPRIVVCGSLYLAGAVLAQND